MFYILALTMRVVIKNSSMERRMHIFASSLHMGSANTFLSLPPTLQNDYDTFGSSAAEMALSAARRDAESRPSIIPGGVLEELIVPVANSIGEWGGGGRWGAPRHR